jgi:transcriptional regulator with XRE-family HTH domain
MEPRTYTIRELREANNMTQQQFANLLGVSMGSITNWERGLYRPQDYFIEQLCELFRINESQLQHVAPITRKGRVSRVPNKELVLPS